MSNRSMKVVPKTSLLKRLKGPVCMAAGFFDGVHAGHREILRRAADRAKELGGQAWVLTFDRHPLKVLCPERAPRLLTSSAHKLDLLAGCGIDGCVMLSFSRDLAEQEPVEFVRRLLRDVPALREVFVGMNWRFGRKASGNPALLRSLLAGSNASVNVVPAVRRGGRVISSSRIRAAVLAGKLNAAAQMLGRPFSVLGTVTHGHRVGRTIGFPTANLLCHGEVVPPCGVYAVRALVGGRMRNGVLNVGLRPTFSRPGSRKISVELHLPGIRRNLYGRDIEVFFIRRLRGERRFSSPSALAAQIKRDIARAAAGGSR